MITFRDRMARPRISLVRQSQMRSVKVSSTSAKHADSGALLTIATDPKLIESRDEGAYGTIGESAGTGLRGVHQGRGHLGPSALVLDLRHCRMLRRFKKQTREKTLSFHSAPAYPLDRARRGVGLVLPRSDGAYPARADADALKFHTIQRRTTIPVNDQIADAPTYRRWLKRSAGPDRLTPDRFPGQAYPRTSSTVPARKASGFEGYETLLSDASRLL